MPFLASLHDEQQRSHTETGFTFRDPRGFGGSGGKTRAGITVDEETALKYSAFWCGVNLIAGHLSSFPLFLYRRKDGGKERYDDHHVYEIVHDNANKEMTSLMLRRTMQAHVLTWGNGYAEIGRNALDQVSALWLLTPDRVKPFRDSRDKRLKYRVTNENHADTILEAWQMLHIPGLGFDGLVGYSILHMMRESIGLGLAMERFGASFFGQGATFGGVFTHPGTFAVGAKKNLEDSLKGNTGVDMAHRFTILEEGMKYERLGIPPEDAQYLECVAPGTLLSMADGTRRKAETLRAGDRIVGWNGSPVVATIAATSTPPLKSLVRIRTHRGREIVTSADHPFLAHASIRTPGGRPTKAASGWLTADALTPGNYVCVGLGMPTGVAYAQMDTREAYFIGAMVGDGYIGDQFSFTGIDEGVLAAVGAAAEQMGGGLTHTTPDGAGYTVRTGGVGRGGSPMRTLLKEAGLVGSHSDTKRVPEMVFRGGPHAWCAFLSGYLDTDGSVIEPRGQTQPKVYWSSVNRDLLVDCQHLLACLGINSSISLMSPGEFRDVRGLYCAAKAAWGLFVTGASQLKLLAASLTPEHSVKSERLAAFRDLPASHYRETNWQFDRVRSVEPLGLGATVGIEVADVHTHVTAGLVTHNSKSFQIDEMARWLNLPPHKLKNLTNSTNNNIEHQGIEYYTDTIFPLVSLWESEYNRKLIAPLERRSQLIEHLVDAVLRGDIASRYAAYAVGRQWGWLSVDDIRERENMNPLPNGIGKIYLVPLNMVAADKLPDPSATPPVVVPPVVVDPDKDAKDKEKDDAVDEALRAVAALTDRLTLAEQSAKAANAAADDARLLAAEMSGRAQVGESELLAAHTREALRRDEAAHIDLLVADLRGKLLVESARAADAVAAQHEHELARIAEVATRAAAEQLVTHAQEETARVTTTVTTEASERIAAADAATAVLAERADRLLAAVETAVAAQRLAEQDAVAAREAEARTLTDLAAARLAVDATEALAVQRTTAMSEAARALEAERVAVARADQATAAALALEQSLADAEARVLQAVADRDAEAAAREVLRHVAAESGEAVERLVADAREQMALATAAETARLAAEAESTRLAAEVQATRAAADQHVAEAERLVTDTLADAARMRAAEAEARQAVVAAQADVERLTEVAQQAATVEASTRAEAEQRLAEAERRLTEGVTDATAARQAVVVAQAEVDRLATQAQADQQALAAEAALRTQADQRVVDAESLLTEARADVTVTKAAEAEARQALVVAQAEVERLAAAALQATADEAVRAAAATAATEVERQVAEGLAATAADLRTKLQDALGEVTAWTVAKDEADARCAAATAQATQAVAEQQAAAARVLEVEQRNAALVLATAAAHQAVTANATAVEQTLAAHGIAEARAASLQADVEAARQQAETLVRESDVRAETALARAVAAETRAAETSEQLVAAQGTLDREVAAAAAAVAQVRAEEARAAQAETARTVQADEARTALALAEAQGLARAAEADRALAAAAETHRALETQAAETARLLEERDELRALIEAGQERLRQATVNEHASVMAVVSAHRALVVDVMRRMIERETDRARRAQASPEKLRQWMETFYEGHEDLCRTALLPAVRVHVAWMRSEEDAFEVARRWAAIHVATSRRQLLTVLDGDADEVAASLPALLHRWEIDRPGVIADALMQDELDYARQH